MLNQASILFRYIYWVWVPIKITMDLSNDPLPFGCMTYYDMVVCTINKVQSYLEVIKSQKYRSKVMDMMQYYHAEKRLMPFIRHLNSFTPTAKFDIERMSCEFFDGHCLVCGTYDIICDHRALADDCRKVSSEMGRVVNLPRHFQKRLDQFLLHDEPMYAWEDRKENIDHPPECMVLQREWRAECAEAEVVLQNLKWKREEGQRLNWLALAMGLHPRLGANSPAHCLDPEIIDKIMTLSRSV